MDIRKFFGWNNETTMDAYRETDALLRAGYTSLEVEDAWGRMGYKAQFEVKEQVYKAAAKMVAKKIEERIEILTGEITADARLKKRVESLLKKEEAFDELQRSHHLRLKDALEYLTASLRDNGHPAMADKVATDINSKMGWL